MIQYPSLPLLTTAQMVEVDRLMIEEWQITLIQMMENAGRNLAELTKRFLGGSVAGKKVVVLSGMGNNGGGGMVAARHLHNWGARIDLAIIGDQEKLKEAPAVQARIAKKMGIVTSQPDLSSADVIIDALIGYGLTGAPRSPIAEWVTQANASGNPIIALDNPTGLNTTSGIPSEPCIRAAVTLTLALPKVGLMTVQARPYIGDLYLADISVPPELYAAPSLQLNFVSPFLTEPIIKLN